MYEKSKIVNGKQSWLSNDQVIWWISEYSAWVIGDLTSLGTDIKGITGVTDFKSKFGLPSDPKNSWKYWNGTSFVTITDENDINVECVEVVPSAASITPSLEGIFEYLE